MPPEVDRDDLTELGGLAATLTGDRERAARLVGETLAAFERRRRTPEPTTLRDLLVECYLVQRPAPTVAPPADDPPGELDEVIARLGGLGPFERAALVLLRHLGLPLAEVAGVLDSSAATVRRRVAEAEERLSLDPLVVRAALETLSWRTPDAAAVAAARFRAQQANTRRRGRRRMLSLALGLVLLAALVIPTVRMLQPLPVRTAGDWLLGIDLEPPPGWSTELHAVTPDQELLQLASETGSCRVVASLPSTPADERIEPPIQAERVWVRGRSVQYFRSGLRWVYGDGGDVTLTCTDQDRAGLLGMADRIRFTAGRPFALPFALEQLPTGMRLVGAGYQDDMPVIALSRERMDTFVLITVLEQEPTGRPTTLDGVSYRLYTDGFSRRLCRSVQSMAVCVEARTNDITVPRSVVRSLRLAPDLADRSTWFDARAALPD